MKKSCLIDSNILVYALDNTHCHYGLSISIIDKIINGEIIAYITAQNLFETFAIITSNRFVSKPLNVQDAYALIFSRYISDYFNLIYDKPLTWQTAFDIAQKANIVAQGIHDIHLVATMLDNGLNNIITYNKSDFQQFLNAFHPSEISGEFGGHDT